MTLEPDNVYLGDCLELMKDIPDKSIDMILCDLPYGNFTACKWDIIIPFQNLWESYERVISNNGAICLFSSQPFTTALISSKIDLFKYCWYWKKNKPNGWQHSKNKPMTAIEEICVFSKAKMGHVSQLGDKRMRYSPQGIISAGKKTVKSYWHGESMGKRGNQVGKEFESFTNFPHNVLEYDVTHSYTQLHPTQKPVVLCEYLIKTYTNEGDLVLDNCAGSGSTLVAAKNLNRRYIGVEKEEKYFNICKERLK